MALHVLREVQLETMQLLFILSSLSLPELEELYLLVTIKITLYVLIHY